MPERVEVRCYAGGRGEETPRSVLLEGRELPVWVERGWVEQPAVLSGTERRRVFQVRCQTGAACAWLKNRTPAGRSPPGPARSSDGAGSGHRPGAR
jgi:hypothetical protein